MNVRSTLLLAGYALVSMAGQASTTPCDSRHNACENAKWADAIFTGKAVAVSESDRVTTFEVTELFKGNLSRKVNVQSDILFQVGREYLVFAKRHGELFQASSCSANEPIENADQHLLYLRHLGAQLSGGGTLPGYVFGRISNRTQDFTYPIFTLTWPAAGVPVRAWQNGFKVRTVTSKSGWYNFFDLPPGHYQIAVDGPTRYQVVGDIFSSFPASTSVDVRAGTCPGISFVNASRAVVKGRIFDDEGEPDESSSLQLVPVDEHPSSKLPPGIKSELETDTQDDGVFRFEVPAGRYRLAVKPLGEITLVYYPEILVLEDLARPGSHETEIEFRLPKRPVQVIEGTLLDADGRPVEGALLRLWGEAPDGSKSSGQVQSDSEGWFGFEVLPMNYEIVAEWPACEHLTSAKIHVRPGQTEPVVISLPLHGDRRCPKSP